MISVTNTLNNTGVTIHGDHMDFDELYDALHTVVGDEEEYPTLASARIRVLASVYEICI